MMFMSFNSNANGATSGERAAYPPPPGNTWVHVVQPYTFRNKVKLA